MPIPLTLGALSKRFKASLRSPPHKAMMSVCVIVSMLITGAMLLARSDSHTLNECVGYHTLPEKFVWYTHNMTDA